MDRSQRAEFAFLFNSLKELKVFKKLLLFKTTEVGSAVKHRILFYKELKLVEV